MANSFGKFIVSLDFELMWGVRDIVTIENYGEHILGVHQALPMILEYFKKYDIKGTFATVGFLFFKSKEELLIVMPTNKPNYTDSNLSPYGSYITQHVGDNYECDPYHFAPHLIQCIKDTPHQEIGTHTFSHFYCLEEGQTLEDFRSDLQAAIVIAKENNIHITSIIFPRNQFNEKYLEVCAEMGIITYRNNEDSWIYSARTSENERFYRRALRLIDAYINLSGHHCYSDEYMNQSNMVNIPSSRFLRPYSSKLQYLDWLRLRRIKKSMTYAAKNNLLYHLWWHPHNFGIHQSQNFSFLDKILLHYKHLHDKYLFSSYTMSGFAKELLGHKNKIK